jgi:putative lipase involved disintegration of autophagic bodies
MANAVYNSYKDKLIEGDIAYLSETIQVALLDSTGIAAIDIDADVFWDDVSANEVSGTGYTTKGITLASKTSTQDNTNDRGVMDAADVTWSSSTITARGAVVFKDTGTPGTSPLMGVIDFAADKSSSSSDFTIQWHADGILYIS